jgi:hypothetical protein
MVSESGFDRAKMIQPEVMAPPLVWLVSDAAAKVTGRRFLAVHWDTSLPPEQAAEKLGHKSRARDMRQPPVYVLNHSQHNFRKRSTQEDLDEIEDWTDRAARRMYEGAGLAPKDVDIFNPYDGYAQFFLERRQSGDRALPYGHVHRQHRAAPRHGRPPPGHGSGRDCAGGIHHAKQWRLDHVRQIPELTARDTGDHWLAAITLSHVPWYWSKSNSWYQVRRSVDAAQRRL